MNDTTTQATNSRSNHGNKYVTAWLLALVAAAFFFATVTHLLF